MAQPTKHPTADSSSSSSSSTVAVAVAVARKSTSSALMPPPLQPARKIKRPPVVLDEDTYTSALSHIVARDFFPGLLEERARAEYLDAVESGNGEWIAEARRGLEVAKTPRQHRSIGGNSTPSSPSAATTVVGGEGKGGGQRPDTTLSLSAFQAKYTSEDNASFNALLEKQSAARRERRAWVWAGNNKLPSRQMEAQRRVILEARRRKRVKGLIGSGARDLEDENEEGDDGDEDDEEVRRRRQAVLGTDLDARPAMPDVRLCPPRNALMFHPSTSPPPSPPHTELDSSAAKTATAAPPSVRYEATRFPPVQLPNRPPSPSMSAVNDALAGRPRRAASSIASSDAGGGGETPRVNGYAFVDAVPPPEEEAMQGFDLPSSGPWHQRFPSGTRPQHHRKDAFEEGGAMRQSGKHVEEEREEDLLAILGPASSGPNPFTIQDASRREALHLRIVDRAAKRKREASAAAGGRTPVVGTPVGEWGLGGVYTPKRGLGTPGKRREGGETPRFKSAPMLTPAGKRLLDRVGGIPPRGEEGKGRGGKGRPSDA